MIKVRTAKKTFADSFGNEVKAGDAFGIVEVRPLFVSRKGLQDALDELSKATDAPVSTSADGQQ